MSWPLSPSNGQQTTVNGIVYVYDAANAVWNRLYQTTVVGGGIVTAVTVTQASQPNITSVGLMANMTSSGNIVAANLMGPHANGSSNVNIPAINGNINLSVGGTANVLVITGTGVNVAGTFNTGTGNANVGNLGVTTDLIVGGNLFVNGSTTSVNSTVTRVVDPIVEQGGGANGAALGANDGKDRGQLLHYYSSGVVDGFMGWKNSAGEFILASNVSVASEIVTINTYGNLHVGNANLGNLVTANYHSGNGSLLSSITGANITGWAPNANIANTVAIGAQPNITSIGTLVNTVIAGPNSITGGNLLSANYITGTITTPSQTNITSVGTLSSLTVSGLVTATAGGIKVGNIQDPTGTNTISISSGNVSMLGNLNVGTGGTGNVTATYFIGNAAFVTGLPAGYSNTNAAGYLPIHTGNIGGNILTLTGNATAINANLGNLVTSNYVAGTLTTAAQPNITSVGTLAGLTIGGSLTFQQSQEVFQAISGATGAVTHDFSTGATFYHTSVAGNFTASISNLPSTAGRISLLAVIIAQGSTGYICTGVSINGGSVLTTNWLGGTAPVGSATKTDCIVFTIINNSGSYSVLGQIASYG